MMVNYLTWRAIVAHIDLKARFAHSYILAILATTRLIDLLLGGDGHHLWHNSAVRTDTGPPFEFPNVFLHFAYVRVFRFALFVGHWLLTSRRLTSDSTGNHRFGHNLLRLGQQFLFANYLRRLGLGLGRGWRRVAFYWHYVALCSAFLCLIAWERVLTLEWSLV